MISGLSSKYVPVLGIHGQAVLLTVFSLLGDPAPAGEEAPETSSDLAPTAPLIPATAPQSEQAQSPAPIQVQGLHQVNMPAPNPEPQHAHALALT